MFALEKWYLDLVDAPGNAMIGYTARIRSGRLSAGYASCLVSAPDRPPIDVTTIRNVQHPELRDRRLTWHCPSLDLDGEWTAEAPPIGCTLLETEAGSIQWSCLLPRARGTVRMGAEELTGYGYVECLRLTLPPGQLPFNTLRWGRHVSDRHSVVWIEWEGASARRAIWLDGVDQPGARVTPIGLTELSEGRSLQFAGSRTLRDRPVLGAVGEALPGFARRLAGPLATMREHKRLDRSSVMKRGLALDHGWTIHEEVTW